MTKNIDKLVVGERFEQAPNAEMQGPLTLVASEERRWKGQPTGFYRLLVESPDGSRRFLHAFDCERVRVLR